MNNLHQSSSAAPAPGETNAATLNEPATAPPSFPPTAEPRYQLLAEIARGGMGVIWRATDTALSREVAVKVLQDHFAPDSAAARRFAVEARITAQLQHPAIPPVHDCGSLPDGRPFLAMKLIKGQTLDELLRQRRDPADHWGRILAVFEQVCQAMAYAHAHRVIHRDLKPGNVMVGGFGEVQVMDWGLAKVLSEEVAVSSPVELYRGETLAGTRILGPDAVGLDASGTQAGSILGTLMFIPPEQAAGEIAKVTQRSDVFGLGAILAVILTGEPPYSGPDSQAVRIMAIRGDLSACWGRLDGCGAEPELVALCKRCLAFAPEDRPLDAGVVAEEVAGLRAAAQERARKAETERAAAEARAAEQRRKRRWQLAAAAAAVLVMLISLVGLLQLQQEQKKTQNSVQALSGANTTLGRQRYEMALDALKMLNTGMGEDDLPKKEETQILRQRLLREAVRFQATLQVYLGRQNDAASQRALAESYFLLAEMTHKAGSLDESLALHGKALELRRRLAAQGAIGAEQEVAQSQRKLEIYEKEARAPERLQNGPRPQSR